MRASVSKAAPGATGPGVRAPRSNQTVIRRAPLAVYHRVRPVRPASLSTPADVISAQQ